MAETEHPAPWAVKYPMHDLYKRLADMSEWAGSLLQRQGYISKGAWDLQELPAPVINLQEAF